MNELFAGKCGNKKGDKTGINIGKYNYSVQI